MTYAAIMLGTISVPLLRSFESRIQYYRKFKALFVSVTLVAIVFLIWDAIFTRNGVWGFGSEHLLGVSIAGLPLEEISFFFIVPYACLFIYETMNLHIKKDLLGSTSHLISGGLAFFLLILGLMNLEKAYTSITFISAAVSLFGIGVIWRPQYMGRFFVGYLVSLVPFFIVNGLLTGSFLDSPIVWYNNEENLGIRMGTIPVEDSMYMLLHLLWVTVIYEKLLSRRRG